MIRQALGEGPSTADELGAILNWGHDQRSSMRLASAWLSQLKNRGEVHVVGQTRSDFGKLQNIYALIGKGGSR